jgi:hypothetical protein
LIACPHVARRIGALLPLALLLALSGCESSPVAIEPTPPEPPAPELRPRILRDRPSFALDIQEIFVRRGCSASGCHGAEEPSAGLSLMQGRAHQALVGVQARAEDYLLVRPGSPDLSYLIIRLEGRQKVGNRMPLGQAPLDSIDLGNLRNWIQAGAEKNE